MARVSQVGCCDACKRQCHPTDQIERICKKFAEFESAKELFGALSSRMIADACPANCLPGEPAMRGPDDNSPEWNPDEPGRRRWWRPLGGEVRSVKTTIPQFAF